MAGKVALPALRALKCPARDSLGQPSLHNAYLKRRGSCGVRSCVVASAARL